MKQKILTMLAIAGIFFAGCSSDRSNNADSDSLITDTSIIDTAMVKPDTL